MGLREFLTSIQKNASSLRNNLGKSISNSISGLQNYVSSVWPQRKPEVNLKDIDEAEFDKLARERGYRKVGEDYYEERERRATEAEATPRDISGDRIEDYEVKPLTPEQKAKLDVLYYGVYTVVEEYTTTSASGVTTTSRPKPPFTKKTITVGDLNSVIGLIRDDIYSAPKGRSDSIILIEYTIYRILKDTGETEVVLSGVDI